MIKYTNGDILKSKAKVLVNPVNCVGVMGAGLAAQFKGKMPAMFKEYEKACADGEVEIGKCHYWYNKKTKQWVCNFPTKEHWLEPSFYTHIVMGLQNLVEFLNENDLKSVAIPRLGCGLGGLEWQHVNKMICDYFKNYSGECLIFNRK